LNDLRIDHQWRAEDRNDDRPKREPPSQMGTHLS